MRFRSFFEYIKEIFNVLRHIVTYKFLPEAQGRTKSDNLKIAKALANDMAKSIPELLYFRCGVGSPDQKADNYDIILICDLSTAMP